MCCGLDSVFTCGTFVYCFSYLNFFFVAILASGVVIHNYVQVYIEVVYPFILRVGVYRGSLSIHISCNYSKEFWPIGYFFVIWDRGVSLSFILFLSCWLQVSPISWTLFDLLSLSLVPRGPTIFLQRWPCITLIIKAVHYSSVVLESDHW